MKEGRGYTGNLYFSSQFCCETKTTVKSKLYFLKNGGLDLGWSNQYSLLWLQIRSQVLSE